MLYSYLDIEKALQGLQDFSVKPVVTQDKILREFYLICLLLLHFRDVPGLH